VKLAVVSLAIVVVALVAGARLTPSAHAQISSITGLDQVPPFLRGTCFASPGAANLHYRVEEVRGPWVRVATAADKNQTNSFVRIEARWLQVARFQEVVLISGPKACDFLD
jgi:hypothetical protein